MKDLAKVFLALFFGGVIGTVVALQFTLAFCWVGSIAGGGLAYFLYKFEDIRQVIPIAWQSATNYNPDWAFVKKASLGYLYNLAVVFPVIFFGSLAICVSLLIPKENEIRQHSLTENIWTLGLLFSLIIFLLTMFSSLFFLATISGVKQKEGEIDKVLAESKKFFKENNFIALICRTIAFVKVWIVEQVKYVFTLHPLRRIGLILKGIAVFIWSFLSLIHSSDRLLMLSYAAVGVTMGAYFNSLIIGGLVAAIPGTASYYICKNVLNLFLSNEAAKVQK